MSARPAVPPPQWASNLTNNTEPSLGQKQSGWTPNQDGISDYDNWYKETAWEWLVYFADGNIDLGNVNITGTLTVAGVSTFNSRINVGNNRIVHGDWSRLFPTESLDVIELANGTVGRTSGDGGSALSANSPGTTAVYRVPPLNTNERLKSIVITGTGTGSTIGLYSYNPFNATYAPIAVTGGSGTGSAHIGNVGGTWTLSPAGPADANAIYVIKAVCGVGNGMALRCGQQYFDVVP